LEDRTARWPEEKHRLVADASHGLRTPLAVMRAELDLSLRDGALPEAARQVLASACEEVDKMSRTVDNLLTLAQVDEGRLAVLTTRVELLRAVESAAGPLQPLAATKGVRLVVSGPPSTVQADAHRLQQALTNFIDNAIRFAPPGGEVEAFTWCADGEAGVTVIDRGPGIPAEDRDRVFDRFYRVPGAGAGREPGGSGLGLAICREVAHAHRGRVWIDSAPGGGTAVSMALPAEGPDPSGADRPRRPQAERTA
jgi:signal transduction histidine kinase